MRDLTQHDIDVRAWNRTRGMDLSLPPRKPHRQSRYTIRLQTGGKRLRLTSRPAK